MNRNEEKSGFGFRDEHPVSETLIFRLIATDSLVRGSGSYEFSS